MHPASPQSVYRVQGRTPDPARIPLPSWRTLLSPLARTSLVVALGAALVLLFNGVIVPRFVLTASAPGHYVRPELDVLETALMFAMLGAPLLLGVLVFRRVRPSWGGFRLRGKIGYVMALVIAQVPVVFAAEYAIFESRGGLHLFEPTHVKTIAGPDGRTAYLFREGLGCGYHVRVAKPWELTMQELNHVPRNDCSEPLPTVRWNADGGVDLLDASGAALLPQKSDWHFGGGC